MKGIVDPTAQAAAPSASPDSGPAPLHVHDRPRSGVRRVRSPGGRRLRNRQPWQRAKTALLFIASAVVLVWFWDYWVTSREIRPTVFPAPRPVWDAFWQDLTKGLYFEHGWVTLQEVLAGFFLGSGFGFVLALLLSEVRILRRLVYPYVIMSQNIPKVALAPLFVVWFGFGMQSKIVLATSITFFPVLVNSLSGFDSVERSQLDLMRVSCARRLSVLWWLKVPHALPHVFAGLELAIVLSVISAVVAEFNGATAGLGYLVLLRNQRLEVAREFGVLVALAILGYALHAIVRFIGRRAVYWRDAPDSQLGL